MNGPIRRVTPSAARRVYVDALLEERADRRFVLCRDRVDQTKGQGRGLPPERSSPRRASSDSAASRVTWDACAFSRRSV